ncbi:MAG TPA: methionyl-tRNA formyltransferase [Candidatus Omnitrophota bacterium]|nr:methionyl-tRNA formyltransferase [Candidatus Omnitrophota bacterium]HPS37496.1 methionyl-tRNA formyltransferase [Candidatus Omnitrophota bacterium]
MKLVFFGSDEFSIKAFEACLHSGLEIALVITTPAQKKGRGLKLEPSEISNYCRAKKLPVAEFQKLRAPETVKAVLSLQPDVFVAASYGKIIPPELLDIPKYRLNVHPSLIPKYRGAAPMNWPILNGDEETGVSIIDIAEKLDAGDVYFQEKLPLSPRINAERLAAQLATLSYGVLKKVLEQVKNGTLHGTPQNEAGATFARQLEKKDGEISFGLSAEEIDRKVRGLQPWPGCYFFFRGLRVGLLEADLAKEPAPAEGAGLPAGTVLAVDKDGGVAVATAKGTLKLLRVKPEGKKEMSAADFARGRRIDAGAVLG